MLKIIYESIKAIVESDRGFNRLTHGLTWAALSVITLGIIAIIIHIGR